VLGDPKGSTEPPRQQTRLERKMRATPILRLSFNTLPNGLESAWSRLGVAEHSPKRVFHVTCLPCHSGRKRKKKEQKREENRTEKGRKKNRKRKKKEQKKEQKRTQNQLIVNRKSHAHSSAIFISTCLYTHRPGVHADRSSCRGNIYFIDVWLLCGDKMYGSFCFLICQPKPHPLHPEFARVMMILCLTALGERISTKPSTSSPLVPARTTTLTTLVST
jgi:hypothetical protein